MNPSRTPYPTDVSNEEWAFAALIVFGVAWINTLAYIILSFILALFFAIPCPALRSLPEKVEIKDYEREDQ